MAAERRRASVWPAPHTPPGKRLAGAEHDAGQYRAD
jgi:hypothetical protein